MNRRNALLAAVGAAGVAALGKDEHMSAREDLAAQLGPPPGEDIIIAQGIIREWNPATFENVVVVDRVARRNMRVGSGAEALTYQPGDVVLVWKWFPGGAKGELGGGTSWIAGRVLTPGTDAATQAVGFMQTNLGAQISRAVTGASVNFDEVATEETRSNSSYGDLATVGPQVTVDVSDVGRALVQFGCVLTSDTALDHVSMSFAVSGATTQPATAFRAVELQFASAVVLSGAAAVLVDNLNEGSNTFTAKYKNLTIGANGFFSARWMIVYPY